jgi:DNA polymerase III alpha subunit
LAGIASGIRNRRNRQGQAIAFFQLDDGESACEAQCFAETFAAHGSCLSTDRPLYVKGRVRKGEEEEPRVNLTELRPLEEMAEGGQLTLRLVVEPNVPDDSLERVRSALSRHHGQTPVFIQVDPGDGHPVLIRLRSQAVRPNPELLEDLVGITGVSRARFHVEGEKPGQRGGSHATGEGAPAEAWQTVDF